MPRGLTFDLKISGTHNKPLERTSDRFHYVAKRMRNARIAFQQVSKIVESGEERHFNSLRGRYVQTGATRDSLTQPNANGALREAHHNELVFGTTIEYAKYLRKGKKSAVLVLKPTERRASAELILQHIVRGVDK